LVYLDHSPTPDDFREFYSAEYFTGGHSRRGYVDYVGDQKTARRSFRAKLEKIERIKAPGRILDIGCAAGFFMEEAAQRGWEVYGHEVSDYAGGIARVTFGDRVSIGALGSDLFPEKSLDVVTMWDVVEHLDNPLDVLLRVRRWLKDDGLLVICTGNVDSWLARLQGAGSRIYNPPQHLYYFSAATLARLLDRAGFRVMRREHDSKSMSVAYFLHIIACLHPSRLTRSLSHAIGQGSVGKRSLTIPLVDNIRVYGVSRPS
jgi:SAM-dependent methyltransferase